MNAAVLSSAEKLDMGSPTYRLVKAYSDLTMSTHSFKLRNGRYHLYLADVVHELDQMLRDPAQLPAGAVLTTLNKVWVEAQERYVITPKKSDRGISSE